MSSRWPKKWIVGLTGNIATGKSTVMRFAARQGALTLDADLLVRQILNDDEDVQSEIAMVFGDAVRLPDGSIDREALAQIVFKDAIALRELERIVHPHVRELLFESIESSVKSIVMIEAIKLIEGGLAAECDEIWVTRCPAETQIERLMSLRKMDRTTAETRVKAQSTQEKKVALADVVIDTSGKLEETFAQVALAWKSMIGKLPESTTIEAGSKWESSAKPAPEIALEDREVTEKQTQEADAVDETLKEGPEVEIEVRTQDDGLADGIIVRRARPTDIPAILLLIHQATGGSVKMTRGELLMALGDRGYLIGQQGTAISAIAGWTAVDQVAAIDQLFVYPAEAVEKTGAAILREIEKTANELLCEVILAFPMEDDPEEIHRLLESTGFEYVDPRSIPNMWREAVAEHSSNTDWIMLKQLLATREVRLQKIKRSLT